MELHIKFVESGTEGVAMKAELTPGFTSHDIFFRSNDITLTKNTEALLSVALLPCMITGRTLVAEGTISQRLLNATDAIFDFLDVLNPSLKEVGIKNLVPGAKELPQENRVGTFFSAGVDSFYTLLKHQEEITDLIFVHGFDICLDDHALRKKTSEAIREIGLKFNKRVIEVETNLRSVLDTYLSWFHSHGAFLASVGYLLSPFFRRLYFPATHTQADADRLPWGSHPALDPLWSTETLEFVHDGCEASRIEKVTMIAESEVALKSLRVCGINPDSAYNCGRCEKCIRTMINLHIAGALDRCTTFDHPLEMKYIEKMPIYDISSRILVEENLKALESRPHDREIYNAIRKALWRSRWVNVLIKYPRLFKTLQWIYRALKRLGKRFR